MTAFNIFKKKKEEKKPEKKAEKKAEKKVQARKEPRKPAPKKRKKHEAWKVLKSPQVTEKASSLEEKRQYVFRVWPRSNKKEVKEAVEGLFQVPVSSVRIINIPSKKMRMGRIEGRKKGYKKAIVKLEKGQKIELMPR